MKKKIVYDLYGQTCNCFWEYLTLLSWAINNNGKILALFWDSELINFDNLRKNKYISFPLYSRFLERIFGNRKYRIVHYKLFHNSFVQRIFASDFLKKRGFVSARDYLFSQREVYEIWPRVNDLFVPNNSITCRIDNMFSSQRSNFSKIVGVHIRRGDYRTFHNGFFYYTDEEYKDFMRQVVGLLGKETKFFLASNERIDKTSFSEFRIFDTNNKNAIEDLYSLSKCDYIIGPFSTFSSWASLYGDVPYYYFKRNDVVTIEKFEIVKKLERPDIQG